MCKWQVFCPRTKNTNGKEHEHKPYKFEIDMHVECQHHAQIIECLNNKLQPWHQWQLEVWCTFFACDETYK
jgi:hypothetical protein